MKAIMYIIYFFLLISWSFLWGETQIGPNTQGSSCYYYDWDNHFSITSDVYFHWIWNEWPCRFSLSAFVRIYFMVLPFYFWLKNYGRKYWAATIKPWFIFGEYLIWFVIYYSVLLKQTTVSTALAKNALTGSFLFSLPLLAAALFCCCLFIFLEDRLHHNNK